VRTEETDRIFRQPPSPALRSALGARSVARPVDGPQDLAGPCEGSDQGVVSQRPLVGEVRSLLLVSVDRVEMRIEIDDAEISSPPTSAELPNSALQVVGGAIECGELLLIESAQEVAAGGRVGNGARSEDVSDRLAALESGEVLEATAAREEIEDLRDDVIGIAVSLRHTKELEVLGEDLRRSEFGEESGSEGEPAERGGIRVFELSTDPGKPDLGSTRGQSRGLRDGKGGSGVDVRGSGGDRRTHLGAPLPAVCLVGALLSFNRLLQA